MRRLAGVAIAMVCGALLGGVPSAHAADQRDWTLRALDLQYELASDLPLRDTPWTYTHNSFNSKAELGDRSVSANDPNQRIDVVAQLDEGVRSLEIDTHLFFSPTDPRVGPMGPVVCHATETHAGCSGEKPLKAVLGEIRGWLDRHPRQVILLYLEGHLDSRDGYDAGADEVQSTLGERIYRPPSSGARCDPLPLELTRNQIRRAGKQVLAMGNCGVGSAWPALVHDERLRITASGNADLRAFPDCGPDFTRSEFDTRITRYYEDATGIGAATGSGHGPISPDQAARMASCGVDLVGFDLLQRGDPRMAGLVWSWAPGQPVAGRDCAVQRADGRWLARVCGERHRVACRDATGFWRVPPGRVTARAAARLCGRPGLVQGVPRTGYEGARLRAAMARAGASDVWLGHRRRGDGWRAYERGGCGPSLRNGRRPLRVRRGRVTAAVALGFACTGERLGSAIVIRGGRRAVRTRTGRRVRIPVARRATRLRVSFTYASKRHTVAIRLARRR